MVKFLKSGMIGLALFTIAFLSTSELSAAPRKSCGQTSYSTKSGKTKSYSKKAPYEGYGKPSKVNGRPKHKIVSGHPKKTTKGYTYVNPYARSE